MSETDHAPRLTCRTCGAELPWPAPLPGHLGAAEWLRCQACGQSHAYAVDLDRASEELFGVPGSDE